ncbi:IclR family transcriptional regulator [Bordetella sp. BOR01]|uniref:IclR family transcriptional regulator n=1 Tax=Bordetella sp. BOR01 TaxID=2854779 RepID=UPI001C475F64|nr:IclR family transcriptional regulator [Bordetella sp. BOR01]MBV7485344.1 IclR family transcriptional regulator [Bordetella sp. BOR01]
MSEPLGIFPRAADDPAAAAAPGGEVRVLARGLALMKAFFPRNTARSNGELAQETGLPKATVSRLTATLTRLGYLDYLSETAQYRLGHAAVALGFGALSTLDIRVRARVHMQRFADDNDLVVVLAVREGMAMVCHEVCRGRGALTIRVATGSRLKLPHSAMGRAWMATLSPACHAAVLRELEVEFPSSALRPALDEAAAEIARSRFCVTVSSLEPDVNSVATPVDFAQSPGEYILGCSVPAFRYPRERCEAEIGPLLLALRSRIEADLAPAGEEGRS